MRLLARIAVAVYAGFGCYILLSVVLGAAGYNAYNELQLKKTQIAENIENLRQINEELRSKRDALLHDQNEIALRARSLGYLQPHEVRVRLPMHPEPKEAVTLGRIVRMRVHSRENEYLLRVGGVCAALLVFIMLMVFGNSRQEKRAR